MLLQCALDNAAKCTEVTLVHMHDGKIGPSFGLFYVHCNKVVQEGWAVTVSRLTLAVIFSITPFLYQSSSVCYAHSQMQKRSMVYLFWTMGYLDQAIRNKIFNSIKKQLVFICCLAILLH